MAPRTDRSASRKLAVWPQRRSRGLIHCFRFSIGTSLILEHFSFSYIPWKQSRNHACALAGEISGIAAAMA